MAQEVPRRRQWKFWTRSKLRVLEEYLPAFTLASKNKAANRVYLDTFAGEGIGIAAETGEEFRGSARIALDVDDPPFTHLRFFEMGAKAERLRDELMAEYPDRDIRVYPGDCNETITQALDDLVPVRHAPAFAFLDPEGMELAWTTLEAISRHRPGPRKVELWMLFNVDGIMRNLALGRDLTPGEDARTTRLFGTDRWRWIWEARRAGVLDSREARAEYLNLMRWRLEQDLGYGMTHPLELVNTKGHPMYTMIFATCHPAGTDIMSSIYTKAQGEIPAMREQILEEQGGAQRLFPVGPPPVEPYVYDAPWEPEWYLPE